MLGVLAACATPAPPSASSFNQGLNEGYTALVAEENGENDYVSGALFGGKGAAAAANELVLPEDPSTHPVHESEVADITGAHSRLMSYLDRGAREIRPSWAAKAQTNFDCWVEEASEKNVRGGVLQPAGVAACKAAFDEAMAKIEPFLPSPPQARMSMFEMMPDQAPGPGPKPMMAEAGPVGTYLVFFDWDKSSLTPEALGIVRTAAAAAKKSGGRVDVTGHADRSGSDAYNMGLSRRRGDAVKAELVKQGVKASSVSVFAKGETEPLVATPDGVREPQNRRAQIVIMVK
ncbi:MAG: OmpA family protein [Alphaproteobacteria bacterium]